MKEKVGALAYTVFWTLVGGLSARGVFNMSDSNVGQQGQRQGLLNPAGLQRLQDQATARKAWGWATRYGGKAKAGTINFIYGLPFAESFPGAELAGAAESILKNQGPEVLQYGGGKAVKNLKDYLLAYMKEQGVDCGGDELIALHGASHGIDLAGKCFLQPGDVVAIEGPTYMEAIEFFDAYQPRYWSVPLDDRGIRTDLLRDRLERSMAAGERLPKLLYTVPNYQNPTGLSMALERREELIGLAAEYNFMIVEDDAYGELSYDGSSYPSLKALDRDDRVIYLGSFSKTIAPGIRMGWAVGPAFAIDSFNALKNDNGTSPIAQSVVWSYLDQHNLTQRIERLREAYAKKRDVIMGALVEFMPSSVAWTQPEGGFFTWLTLPQEIDTLEMLEDAVEARVSYLPGYIFYAQDPDRDRGREKRRGSNELRLSYSYLSHEELRQGVERLAAVIRDSL